MKAKIKLVDAQPTPESACPAPESKIASAADHGDLAELAELRDKIKQLESQLAHQTTASKREQESLLKMVIGMAVGGYGFDRNAIRSKTTKEIADDLRRAGVPLDEGTVLKWLRHGSELLPGD